MDIEHLSDKIIKHLFLLCPNNSGSTFIQESFRNCKKVAVLDDEGQFTPGFQGEISDTHNLNHIFTLKSRIFENQKGLNEWHANEYYWDQIWDKNNPDADWKFEKSPPNILRPHLILDCFINVSFIIMVRNPYAMAESILRANPNASIQDIGNHVLNCLTIQRKNCYLKGNNLIFTYEDMCDRPEWVETQIKTKFEIDDFVLSANIDHHSKIKSKSVKNYNDEQISRLKKYHIIELNEIFSTATDTLDFWGYSIVEVNEIGFNVNELFEHDVTQLKEKVLSISEEDWFKFEKRNESFIEHNSTHSICLYSEAEEGDEVYSEKIKNEEFLKLFGDDLKALNEKYLNKYKSGRMSRILLARLDEFSKIPSHNDSGIHLNSCRRTHIPIVTNDDVEFYVNDEQYSFKENMVYEFDNTKKHAVYNNSEHKRVHMIVDWSY